MTDYIVVNITYDRRNAQFADDYKDQHFYRTPDGSLGGPACLPVSVLGVLPQYDYRVEWRVSPDGAYEVVSPHRVKLGCLGQATICFLPRAWTGERVSRRVLTEAEYEPNAI